MSAVITKIEKNEAGVFLYKDTDDNIQFVGVSTAHIRPLNASKALVTDTTGKSVNVPYATFEGVIIDNIFTPFSGTFQEFIELLASLVTQGASGGGGFNGEVIGYDFDNTPIVIATNIFTQDLPPFTAEFETGIYEISYGGRTNTSGNINTSRRILLDGGILYDSVSLNGSSANKCLIETIITPLSGNHTLEFVFAGQNLVQTFELSNRFYKITRIA